MERYIRERDLTDFVAYLRDAEKAKTTISKYGRDIRSFYLYADDRLINRELVLSYKEWLLSQYSVRSANSMLAALNTFFHYMNWLDLVVKAYKVQQEIFRDGDKELTKEEYYLLLDQAWKDKDYRLYYIMETLGTTGIRISELVYITVEMLGTGHGKIRLKGKSREIYVPKALREELLSYARDRNITSGSVFLTRGGNPVDRCNVNKEMKQLAKKAGIPCRKIYPHNLRHLFAVSFYEKEKDICRLADILGHSNINTTRIYTMISSREHEKQIEQLGLFVEKCHNK